MQTNSHLQVVDTKPPWVMQTGVRETTEREGKEWLQEGHSPSLQYVAHILCLSDAWLLCQTLAIPLQIANKAHSSPLPVIHCKLKITHITIIHHTC